MLEFGYLGLILLTRLADTKERRKMSREHEPLRTGLSISYSVWVVMIRLCMPFLIMMMILRRGLHHSDSRLDSKAATAGESALRLWTVRRKS